MLILLRFPDVRVKDTPQEEAMLEERFGDAYRDYRRRTGRFVPRIRVNGDF